MRKRNHMLHIDYEILSNIIVVWVNDNCCIFWYGEIKFVNNKLDDWLKIVKNREKGMKFWGAKQ